MLMMALRHCSMCKLRLKMSICSQTRPPTTLRRTYQTFSFALKRSFYEY